MWTKYNKYRHNNIEFKCSSETKELLGTELTEKQLLLLDKREDKIDLVLFIMFVYGVLLGALLTYFIYLLSGVII